MTDEYVKEEDKMLCAASYALGVPSLYIILTDKRKDKFTGFHGTQALFFWIAFIIIWVAMRVILDVIFNVIYLPFLNSLVNLILLVIWFYALFCGYRAYMGEFFTIPYISDLIKKGS